MGTKFSNFPREEKGGGRMPSSDDDVGGTGDLALVTGAASGIGRSIAVQLARRGVPLVLLDLPGNASLDHVASDLRRCYGASVALMRADLSRPGEGRRVHAREEAMGWRVRHLVLCAGWGPTALHADLADTERHGDALERAVRINVESTAVLSSLYCRDMAVTSSSSSPRSAPTILIVSSIMGMGPGLLGAALYGATKAFGLSLGRALSLEMEPCGVGVAVLCPGPTRTGFARASGMQNNWVWHSRAGRGLLTMGPDEVADGAVRAMLSGRKEYVPGWINAALMRVAVPLMPTRMAMQLLRFGWSPWPFSFPREWSNNEHTST